METKSIIVHAHPIIEMQINNLKKDNTAECVLYNKEFNQIESSFLLDEEKANEVISLMQIFLNNCR